MHKATTHLFGAAASREIDARLIADLGIPGYVLMQRAADAAFACLLQNFQGVKSLAVCCGKGNNAGDGYLLARLAQRYGIQTRVIAALAPAELEGDAARAHGDAVGAGVPISVDATAELSGEVIVDALLGTGLKGAPREPFASLIAKINDSGKRVLSIDIPSGVSADSGAVFDHAVRADVTISFITRKIGLYTGPGMSYAGQRVFDDLGAPDDAYAANGVPSLHWRPGALPALDVNTYKHRQGHVVVAGGDVNMPGAVAMAAAAALRVGAGMVTAVTQAQHAAPIVARTPEVMVASAAAAEATGVMARADLIILGPGLGRSTWSKALYHLAEQANKPTVLDADGLYWLAQEGAWHGGALVVTPHIAEAARLLDCSAIDVQQDRLGACARLRECFHCQGVLKGAGSIVFDGTARAPRAAICAHGNPGMATAGMGDVLSGVLGGLLATGEGLAQGLRAGVALHSAAADAAAARFGERSLLATDVIGELPGLLRGST